MKRPPLGAVAAALLLAGALGGGLWLWRSGALDLLADRRALSQAVVRWGAWGPVALILIEIAQVLLAPIPGQAAGMAAGYLYGPWLGAAIAMVGLGLGTFLAVWMARQLGRRAVERWLKPALVSRLDALVQRRGLAALFAIYLLPFLPDDAVCFLAGLTPLPIGQVLAVAMIGRLPGVLVSTWLGAHARQLSVRAWLWWSLGLTLITLAAWLWGGAVRRWLLSRLERWGR